MHGRQLQHDRSQPLAGGSERRRQFGRDHGLDGLDLFFFQTDAANFCDYPSLGVDSGSYTGCNMLHLGC